MEHKVIANSTASVFEAAVAVAQAQGFKILPATLKVNKDAYAVVMIKPTPEKIGSVLYRALLGLTGDISMRD